MKTTIILFLTLAACGAQQKTFEFSADTLPQDKAAFIAGMDGINAALGCNQVIAGTAEQTFTMNDVGSDYNFVLFTNNTSAANELVSGANKTRELLGETVILPGETDIVLTSFTAHPPSEDCVQTATNCVVDSELNAKRITALATFISVHEMGHALGLNHTTDPSDIMFATAGEQVSANGITQAQWDRYVEQLKAAGVTCPQGGY